MQPGDLSDGEFIPDCSVEEDDLRVEDEIHDLNGNNRKRRKRSKKSKNPPTKEVTMPADLSLFLTRSREPVLVSLFFSQCFSNGKKKKSFVHCCF